MPKGLKQTIPLRWAPGQFWYHPVRRVIRGDFQSNDLEVLRLSPARHMLSRKIGCVEERVVNEQPRQ